MKNPTKTSILTLIAAILLLLYSCSDSSTSFDESLPDEFTLTILVDPEEGGTVEPDERNFVQGTEVELQAVAAEGFRFTGWEGDIQGDENPISVRINENKQITARFEIQQEPAIGLENQPETTVAGERIEPVPTLTLTDETATGVPDVTVEVTLNQHAFTDESITTGTTDSEGVVVFDQLFIEKADNNYYLLFHSDSPDFPDRESEHFDVLPAEAQRSSDKVDVPQNGRAGEEIVMTIVLEDRFGNPISDQKENISVQVSGSNSAIADVIEIDPKGTYKATYTPSQSGIDQVSIEHNEIAFEGSPYSIFIFPGSLSRTNSSVLVDPNKLRVGNNSKVIIELKDNFGNMISGKENEILLANTGGAFAGPVNEDGESGIYQSEMTSESVERVSVSVKVEDVELADRPEIEFLVGEPSIFEKISGDGQTGKTREQLPEPFVVRLMDEFFNPVPDKEVQFEIIKSPIIAGGQELSVKKTKTNQQGEASTLLTLGSWPGSYEVEAKASDLDASLIFSASATIDRREL